MRVKIISGDSQDFEDTVNQFLKKVEVKCVFGNVSTVSGMIVAVIFYEEKDLEKALLQEGQPEPGSGEAS